MNQNELQIKIKELRQEGYGYKRIAKELSISSSAVRHLCLKIEDEEEFVSSCKNCNTRTRSTKGKKKKLFCSDKCRLQWWNSNPSKVNKKAYYTHKCNHCHKEFTAYGNNKRLYCSQECYINSKKSNEVNDDEAR